MRKRIKRALALLLACALVTTSVNASRKEAYAMSAAGTIAGTGAVIGTETAFAYLLGVLGLTAASAAVYENQDSIAAWGKNQYERFESWVSETGEAIGTTAAGVGSWLEKLATGVLDKADAAWGAFKEWLSSDAYAPSSSGGTLNDRPWVGRNVSGELVFDDAVYTIDFKDGLEHDYGVYMLRDLYTSGGRTRMSLYVITEASGLRITKTKADGTVSTTNYSAVSATYDGTRYCYAPYRDIDIAWENVFNFLGDYAEVMESADVRTLAIEAYRTGAPAALESEYTYVGGVSKVYDNAGTIGAIDLVNPDAKEAAQEATLTWTDDTSIDAILSGIQAGTSTWTDLLDKVGVGVVEKTGTGDFVVGNEGVTEDTFVYAPSVSETPDIDIPTETPAPSTQLSAYTLGGLETIFPFCLPFDLIDFIRVLEAPPEAPCFTIPFSYPTISGLETYEIEIDLSPFNSVAALLRDMECLLFIVGLAMVTRSQMIRG